MEIYVYVSTMPSHIWSLFGDNDFKQMYRDRFVDDTLVTLICVRCLQ